MGIYIKGMDMPEHCKECYDKGICYHIHHIANCPLCGEIENPASYVLAGIKHPDCPMTPVPPHGRLIDADEIVRYKERLVVDADKINPKIRYVVDTKYIDDAPTIIPAEEGE